MRNTLENLYSEKLVHYTILEALDEGTQVSECLYSSSGRLIRFPHYQWVKTFENLSNFWPREIIILDKM
ncbi:hypothetical protein E2C01_005404 [Portunus trituberculatus]|uniref:Uncharacterized protein n=1 Tax=Portunus trituberculatus TaxID=210409 RepID=A0A5B7CT96_PORTR|nr:hypothetical protein [Portunus trituberculatus]